MNTNMSLSSHNDDPSTSSPLQRSLNVDSPATSTIATSASSFDYGASPDEALWANLRQRELRVADSNSDGYKPAYSASHQQIRAAVREFLRREKEGKRHGFPAVLVATNSKRIPHRSSRSLEDDEEVGKIKFFLDHHRSLFIVSLSGKDEHTISVCWITLAMGTFDDPYDHFQVYSDGVFRVPSGRKAPDAVLKLMLPRAPRVGPLRAPFIAEVRSSSFSTDPTSELLVASQYMETEYADYFLYLFVEKKRPDGLFPAAAVLWRRGADRGPLTGEEKATFVSAQSFGTGELDDRTMTCLRRGGGRYPGVPLEVDLDAVENPDDIIIPKADILRKVMRADGSLHYQRRQGPGHVPVVDAGGNAIFDFPADGPDLVISPQRLVRHLDNIL